MPASVHNPLPDIKPMFFCFMSGWRGPQTRSSSLSTWRPYPNGWERSPLTWWGTWLSSPPCFPGWVTTRTPTPPTTASPTPRFWTTLGGWVLCCSLNFDFSSALKEWWCGLCFREWQWSLLLFVLFIFLSVWHVSLKLIGSWGRKNKAAVPLIYSRWCMSVISDPFFCVSTPCNDGCGSLPW